ncbi:tandem-95 repeat protein [Vibrio splendidus]|uniref:tandem-95 repeat protein n=1 Tax=Vibrio splendidus TaxID=29497 RepID=UPI0023DE11FF|nr:tandem-95 repeat protein [Vibrio splendidus]
MTGENNQNEELNDAVEQTDTNDAGTPFQQQNQQNQQNTIASTIATGAENTDAADEINQALEDNPSGAGNSEEAAASGGAVQEDTPESGGDSDAAQSNVVDSAASDAGAGDAAGSGGGSGAGAQAVGGGESTASEGGSDAEGNEEQGQAARTSAAPSSDSSGSDEQPVGDDLDSQTVEETFAVDVQASDEETISEVEDDFDSETVSETFKIKVESENDAPEAEQDLAYIIDEDGSITFTQEQLLEYASDVDGDELVASNVQVGADATVQDNGDGTFTVLPSADFNGELDLTFDISDGQETISSAIVLTVRPINDAPVPEDKTFEIEEDGTLVFTDADLLTGATDIEGDNLSVEGVTYYGGDGILTDNGDGSYTFAPNENFNGDIDISFDVSDGALTTSANIDLTVNDVNDAPVAGSTSYSVDEDGILTISDAQLLANSSDVDGSVSVDSVAYTGTDGILTDNGDGTHSFAPNENFNGSVSLDVTVVDDDGATDVTTAGIDVIAVNDTPVVSGDLAYSVDEDGAITFSQEQLLANASDLNGDDLTASNLTASGDSTVTDNGDGTFTVTPDEHFDGDITLTFDIADGTETVVSGIDLSVNPVNDAAVVDSHDVVINEDGTLNFTDDHLLANVADFDDDDTHSIDSVSYAGEDGVFSDNGDGTYSFAPNEHFNGEVVLDFVVDDGTEPTASTINVDITAINDTPIAGSTAFSMNEDGAITLSDAQLLANSADVDGDSLNVDTVSYSGDSGTFVDNGDGSYTFTPNENFNGDIALDVSITDGIDTSTTTAQIDVAAVNDLPSFPDPTYTIDEDTSITLTAEDILSNATDVDGDTLTLESVDYSGDDGSIVANEDGSYTFTPSENFNGDLDLSVTINDGTASVSAPVHIQVDAVNDAAVVEDLALSGTEDTTITITQADLLSTATDVDGNDLTASNLTINESFGEVTDNGDGTFSFVPADDYNGDVPLTFTVSDGTGNTQAHGNLDLAAVNDTPVLAETSFSLNEDNSIVITEAELLANATDIDADALSITDISISDGNGSVIQNENGDWVYTPTENYSGDANLTISVNDGTVTADFDSAVTITPDADAPSLTVSLGEMSVADFDDSSIAGGVLTSWQTDNESGTIEVHQDFIYGVGDDRGLVMELEAAVGDEANVFQNLDIEAGDTIELSFDISARAGAAGADSQVDIYFEGNLIDSIQPPVGWETHTYTLTATTNNPRIELDSPSHNGGGAVLDTITISEPSSTDEDTAIALDIDAALVDTDGSESMQSIEVDQIPEGAVLTDGVNTFTATGESDSVDVNSWDLSSLTITTAENFNGDVTLNVTATSVEDANGDTATSTADLSFTVEDVNDAVVIDAGNEPSFNATEDTTFTITEAALLSNATDLDSEDLVVTTLNIPNATFNTVIDSETGDKSFVVTPDENFNGDIDISFNVSDQEGSEVTSGASLTVAAVNDAPEAPTIEIQGEEDVVMVIDPAYIADQVTDLDGDEISIESITVRAPANATLTQQPDGMYHLVTTQDFNGLVELGYQATDGLEVVDGSLNVDVIPVNDTPFNVGNAMMTTDEDGAFTFDAGDLMNLFGDIDTADLVVSRIITADGEDGGEVTDNGDGTWTFTPAGDFAGVSDLQVVVSDGEFETVLDVPVYVRPVADGAVITTDHDGPLVFGEDETGHLGLNVGLVDDSETLSNLVMTGFPVGFEVTDGVNTVMITEPGQYIDLFDWDISNIQMTPPEDFHGEFFVTVSATTVDYGDEPEAFEDGIDSGDFETVAGDSIILTADDLIGLAENVDADSDDEVKLVHLADRSQGEIVDNGDGTWTFTPAPGFTGEADIAYVIDKDGVLHDEQTGVVVKEGDSQENAAPEVNSITTTEIAADATLSFTDQDMLANMSDAEGDSMSIESVSLMEGQGVIESDNQGNYQFTPAEDYTGDVQVGFIATDGENRIESFFNVDIQGGDESAASEGYALADDGSLTITESQLVDELGVSDTAQVVDVADANDAGFFAESGEGEWTYWPNEDFDGNLAMNVDVNDGGEVSSHSLSIQVADDSAQSNEPQVQAAQATEEQQVDVAQQADDQAQDSETETEDSVADVTAAPGDTISISIPDEVSGNESVDYAEMSGLPEGSAMSNALDNGDGSFTISGNLDQPVSVELPEGYEGTSEIQFQGYDELGSSIDGASGSVEVEVDDQYTMQGSTQEQQPDMAGMESGGSDWTSAGGQDQGVDFTDDSGSFDSDSQTGTDQGSDFDQSSI